ncbi:MAG: hypothetical protein R3F37_11065 [Candidatus Competibacteraceae bacterium]
MILLGPLPYTVLVILLVRGQADLTAGVLSSLSLLQLGIATAVNRQLWEAGGCSKRWAWFYPLSLIKGALTLSRASGGC